MFCEPADGGLFVPCYGFEWVAEVRCAAEFYFNEDEGVAFADDEVDLAPACPVVAFDERVAPSGQVAEREVLAPGSKRTFSQGRPRRS